VRRGGGGDGCSLRPISVGRPGASEAGEGEAGAASWPALRAFSAANSEGFIEPGTPVRVVAVRGGRVIVGATGAGGPV
jgi:hypothetical protein